jgi:hypothetical protein
MGQVTLTDEQSKQLCESVLVGSWNPTVRECGAPFMNEPLAQTGCQQIGGAWNGERKVCVFPTELQPGPPGIPGVPGIPVPSWTPPTPPPQPPPEEKAGLDWTKVALYGGVAFGVYYVFIRKPKR